MENAKQKAKQLLLKLKSKSISAKKNITSGEWKPVHQTTAFTKKWWNTAMTYLQARPLLAVRIGIAAWVLSIWSNMLKLLSDPLQVGTAIHLTVAIVGLVATVAVAAVIVDQAAPVADVTEQK